MPQQALQQWVLSFGETATPCYLDDESLSKQPSHTGSINRFHITLQHFLFLSCQPIKHVISSNALLCISTTWRDMAPIIANPLWLMHSRLNETAWHSSFLGGFEMQQKCPATLVINLITPSLWLRSKGTNQHHKLLPPLLDLHVPCHQFSQDFLWTGTSTNYSLSHDENSVYVASHTLKGLLLLSINLAQSILLSPIVR